ncbi:MAG: hypothetical protein QF619_03055 [Candidatus Binatia bacterium]|nr:hypothetical protein [Candidatus Binatia bacterium]
MHFDGHTLSTAKRPKFIDKQILYKLRDTPVNPNHMEIGDIEVTTAYSVVAQEARVDMQMGVETITLSAVLGILRCVGSPQIGSRRTHS